MKYGVNLGLWAILGKVWAITNPHQDNTSYALRLEHGWSKQAPTGVYGNALNSAIANLS